MKEGLSKAFLCLCDELRDKHCIRPDEIFWTVEFVDWDENRVPLKDTNGDVSKSRRKKMLKEREKQNKLHNQWLASKPGTLS